MRAATVPAPAPAAPGAGHTRISARTVAVWLGPLLLLALAIALAMMLGANTYGPRDVIDGLLDRDSTLHIIMYELRLPRVILAIMVGASLGVAGVLLQGVTRNPLADPHILGLTAGAGLAASFAVRLSADIPERTLAPIAFGGALLAALVLYTMSYRGAATSPTRLALSGVAVASLLTAGTTMVLVSSKLTTQAALAWLAGGLFGRGWDEVHVMWPYALGGLSAAVLLSRNLNVLALGDEAAASLGLGVERTRAIAIVTAALLAGVSVAAAGMIAFVGLVIPHTARFLVGDDHRKLVPLSAILGGALIVYADIFARTVQAPIEIPLGIVTAAVGAPFLLYVVRAKT